jgi:hypothetical protein
MVPKLLALPLRGRIAPIVMGGLAAGWSAAARGGVEEVKVQAANRATSILISLVCML